MTFPTNTSKPQEKRFPWPHILADAFAETLAASPDSVFAAPAERHPEGTVPVTSAARQDEQKGKLLSTTDERLRAALEHTLGNFRLMLSQKPVRDAAETIAEAERALAQQAPTPAVLPEPVRCNWTPYGMAPANGGAWVQHLAAISEPAAPVVDARDALTVLRDLWQQVIFYQYSFPKGFMPRELGVRVNAVLDASPIARQAAAGEKP